MKTRSAVDTIKGYFYQFDNTIYRLLTLPKENDFIEIECIEDIDVNISDETLAIQCKYYSKTEYNHSVIKEAIIQMLTHFTNLKTSGTKPIDYLLYANFKSGQDKLPRKIDISFLKENFLTTMETKVLNGKKTQEKILHHEKLRLNDADLLTFLNKLKLNIHAPEYQKQYNDIIAELMKLFKCKEQEAELVYYNNALKVVKDHSTQQDNKFRKIYKKSFLQKINIKNVIFNFWFQELKTKNNYFKLLRNEYFTYLNISPFERFFLIEIDYSNYNLANLKEILYLISKKWSKTSKYEANPFCPYVYLHNISNQDLIKLKNELYSDDFIIIDGHNFEGADFNAKNITRKIERSSKVRLKIINNIENLNQTLSLITKTRHIFQFYINKPFFELDLDEIKHIKIQLENISDIKHII